MYYFVLSHIYLWPGSGFGYYNFLSVTSYCVDSSSLQTVTCCVSFSLWNLVWTFIQQYHYSDKGSSYHNRLSSTLYTVHAINICVLNFLQGIPHTGHTLAPWHHPPVLKVLLGSSSRSQLKCLSLRYVAGLIFPYITLHFKFICIGYVTCGTFPC
jgi:hypothetical protein